jgi:hypothetical protein
MQQHLNSAGPRPWQFSLRALLIAVVFVALASAAASYCAVPTVRDRPPPEPMGVLLALFSVPVFLCGGVGVLRGQLKFWLAYGIVIDMIVIGLVLFSRL